MEQTIPKEKLGGTNLKKNNLLSDRNLQLEYQFIVNLTKVNKLSSEFHIFL